jgi:NAD(P)-dependent dehydrogenase (short-subunit alcohol dehydrogenase family)
MSRRNAPDKQWTSSDVGQQQGRTAVITGANTGVGFETAKVLAEHGAVVVLACRDLDKAARAATRIQAATPHASVTTLRLDLASLASVRTAAAQLRASHPRLDLLVNNAGVMRPPYMRTEDGFELQFGTNHLGHFALTGLLLDRLLAVPGSRVVTVTSPAHRQGRIDFDDLHSEQRYRPMAAYAQSKLANLLFTYELQRRLAQARAATVALAAHPGGARTELNRHMPALALARGPSWGIWRLITQSPQMGALSILRAAVDPDAHGGDYYAPGGLFEYKGYPTRLVSSARVLDVNVQHRLWQVSEQLTGVTFETALLPSQPAT